MSSVPPRSVQQDGVPTLLSVKWLADKLSSGSGGFRLLDATMHMPVWGRDPKAEYEQKHIPNALFFDLDNCFDMASSLSHMLPSPEQFEKHVGELGINNDTHVVLYDNNDLFGIYSVARVWWTFRVFGHKNISILDGGLPKWCAEQQAVTKDVINVSPGSFKAQYQPHLVKSFADIQENLTSKKYLLVDSRSNGRFNGTAPEPDADLKPGHIPESLSMHFIGIINRETKTIKSPEVLKCWFAESGVDLDKPFIVACGSGVTACCLVIAALLCGVDDVPVYDGSWNEWYLNADSSQKVNVPKD